MTIQETVKVFERGCQMNASNQYCFCSFSLDAKDRNWALVFNSATDKSIHLSMNGIIIQRWSNEDSFHEQASLLMDKCNKEMKKRREMWQQIGVQEFNELITGKLK